MRAVRGRSRGLSRLAPVCPAWPRSLPCPPPAAEPLPGSSRGQGSGGPRPLAVSRCPGAPRPVAGPGAGRRRGRSLRRQRCGEAAGAAGSVRGSSDPAGWCRGGGSANGQSGVYFETANNDFSPVKRQGWEHGSVGFEHGLRQMARGRRAAPGRAAGTGARPPPPRGVRAWGWPGAAGLGAGGGRRCSAWQPGSWRLLLSP